MAGLAEQARAKQFRHIHLSSVDSTNAEALRHGEDRLWVTAVEQTAGRGRRGRAWASPPGNLYASLLLRDPCESRDASGLCFVAALALGDAILAAAPRAGADLALKWPNDALIAGAKVAGILVEAVHGAGSLTVVIGCGVNVSFHPDGLPYPATHLAATDPGTEPETVFEALSGAFAVRLSEWRRGEGFAEIRTAWLTRAAGLGQEILVKMPSCDIAGIFEALDADGALILRDASGERRPISAGEIFFPGLVTSTGAIR